MAYSLAIFFLFVLVSKTQGIEQSNIFMSPGDVNFIKTSGDNVLLTSKKGIVDIHYLQNGKWRLTALKKGIVLLKSKHEHFLVKVDTVEVTNKWPKWLCSSMECDYKSRSLGGSASFQYFFRAKDWCSKHKPCLWLGRLKPPQARAWQSYLRKFIPSYYKIKVEYSGETLIYMPCEPGKNFSKSKQELQPYLPPAPYLDSIRGVCEAKGKVHHNYELQARIFLNNQQKQSQSGFKEPFAPSIKLPAGVDLGWKSPIQSHQQQKSMKLLGNPKIIVHAGAKTTIHSGGELPPPDYSRGKVLWKSFGLELQALAQQKGDDQVWLDYVMSFRQPANKNMRSSKLESRVVLELNREALLGTVEMKLDTKEKHGFLQKWPLIGPIFGGRQTEESLVEVLFYLQVKLLN